MSDRSITTSLLLTCCSLLLSGCSGWPTGLTICSEKAGRSISDLAVRNESIQSQGKRSVKDATVLAVAKECVAALHAMARERNHWHFMGACETAELEPENCSESAEAQSMHNQPNRDDHILRTHEERGTSVRVQLNDTKEYICFRTRTGSHPVEEMLTNRHDVVTTQPDPPPVEAPNFGMTVCVVWNSIVLLLWSITVSTRSFLSILGKPSERSKRRENWTSFFRDDSDQLDDMMEEPADSDDEDQLLTDMDIDELIVDSDEADEVA